MAKERLPRGVGVVADVVVVVVVVGEGGWVRRVGNGRSGVITCVHGCCYHFLLFHFLSVRDIFRISFMV